MNNIETLILHGPPAAGKTNLAATLASLLRKKEVRHTVIDMDYLAKNNDFISSIGTSVLPTKNLLQLPASFTTSFGGCSSVG